MYPIRILSEASPRNNSGPRQFPGPVRGCLDKNAILVKEVEGSVVGEPRDNEGRLESSNLSVSTVLGGLRVGGVNVIMVMVASAVEERLDRRCSGRWAGSWWRKTDKRSKRWEEERERGGGEKNEGGESLISESSTEGEP